MRESLCTTVAPRTKLAMRRVNGSNLSVGRKDIMPYSSHKDFKLEREFELPNEPPKEPMRAKPHLS